MEVDSLKENHNEFVKDMRLILKLQQIFRSEKHNVSNGEVNKIALNAFDDKRNQSINCKKHLHQVQAKI